MTNHVPNDPHGETETDAAERGEPRPTPATGPWTGQGPIITNPPHSSHPYGSTPSSVPSPPPPRLRWWVWLLVALAAVAVVALIIVVVVGL